LGRGALGDQLGVATNVAFGAFQCRAVALGIAEFFVELGLQRAVIEREQEITRLDVGAVLEMDFDDQGVDARLHRNTGDGRNGAQCFEPHRHVFLHRLGHLDGHALPALPAPSLRRLGDRPDRLRKPPYKPKGARPDYQPGGRYREHPPFQAAPGAMLHRLLRFI